MQDKPLWFGQVKRWYDSVRWRKARAILTDLELMLRTEKEQPAQEDVPF